MQLTDWITVNYCMLESCRFNLRCETRSYLEPAHNPVIITQVVFVIVPSFAPVQVEGVEPVLKVTELTLQLLVICLKKHSNIHQTETD